MMPECNANLPDVRHISDVILMLFHHTCKQVSKYSGAVNMWTKPPKLTSCTELQAVIRNCVHIGMTPIVTLKKFLLYARLETACSSTLVFQKHFSYE